MSDWQTYKDNDGTLFDIIARCGTYDYSWEEEAILRRKSDGALFYTSDGGCSCNDFGSDGDLSLTPVQSTDEALRMADSREKLAESLRCNGVEVDR